MRILLRPGAAPRSESSVSSEEHEAGLRTHMLVAVGSCRFTLVAAYGFGEFFAQGTPSRARRPDANRRSDRDGDRLPRRRSHHPPGFQRARADDGGNAVGGRRGRSCDGRRQYFDAVVTTIVVIIALGPVRVLARRVLRHESEGERDDA